MSAYGDSAISRPEESFAARHWRTLYQDAVLETDPGRICSRIDAAETAIVERSRQLSRLHQFNAEDAELTSAILALCDLRRKTKSGQPRSA